MRILAGTILLFFISFAAIGHHIIGGEMYYIYQGKSTSGYQYKVVLKLYRGCEPVDNNHSPLDDAVIFSIWNNDDHSLRNTTARIPMLRKEELKKTTTNPCILNPPDICFRIGYYETTVTLPLNNKGYTIAFQRCCRTDLLRNVNTTSFVGASFFTEIPGEQTGVPGTSSVYFKNEEAVLLCSRGEIDYTFDAYNPEGDQLVYDFAPGYTGGGRGQQEIVPVPTAPPPFHHLFYYNGFNGKTPLGEGITIDPSTGEIKGRTHLEPGSYDVTVRVRSYREGKLIATHYRDFQFTIHDCNRVVLADIPPVYNECKSNTIQFTNNSTPGKSYLWDFGDGKTSEEAEPEHTFDQPGTYHVRIKVDPQSNCGDSMESIVKVFPGLKADFKKEGSCIQSPIQFSNESSTPFNDIHSYHWDFGDASNSGDTSREKEPAYQYTRGGTYPVRLTVTTDSGCVQSTTQSFRFYGKPDLQVTADTLLCYKDSIQLQAKSSSAGSYLWNTNYNIDHPKSAQPIVFPKKDTTYHVTFTDSDGCINTDSVQLQIRRTLKVDAGNDTTVCAGDPVTLHARSDGPYAFTWYNTKDSLVKTGRNITSASSESEFYKVVATLGSCMQEDHKRVRVVPYPKVVLLPSAASICYGDSVQLKADGGSTYQWSPTNGLSDSTGNVVMAHPLQTTTYTLRVIDTLGCPKPVDTQLQLVVIPPVQAFAGNDTIITAGLPFQLHASGGDHYEWTPATGLDDPTISNPTTSGTEDAVYVLKATVDPEGCYGYDTVSIRYMKGPDAYVPTAFTPNGDGQNDIFRPVPVGITKIKYFRIYNRWGQLIYQTSTYMKGWDGTYNGKPAAQGSYVWMLKAEDFNGKPVVKKGAVTLLR